jgi:hypothetical protein
MPLDTIGGKVLDRAGRSPVPDAVIVWSAVESQAPPLRAPTMWVATDAQGEFTIQGLPLEMTFTLTVSACGFKGQTITLRSGSLDAPSSPVDIEMERLGGGEFGICRLDPQPGSSNVSCRQSLRVSFNTKLRGDPRPTARADTSLHSSSPPRECFDYSWVGRYLSIRTADNREIGGSTRSEYGFDVIFEPDSALDFDQVQLAVVSGALADEVGQQLGSDFVWDFRTESQVPTPEVVSVSPQPYAGEVTAGSNIEITFNVEISAATIDTSHIQVRIGQSNPRIDGTFTCSGPIVTFTPSEPLILGTTYTVTVSGVQNQQGTPMVTERTYSFATCNVPWMDLDDSVPVGRGLCDGLFWGQGHVLGWKYKGWPDSPDAYVNQVDEATAVADYSYTCADAYQAAAAFHAGRGETHRALAVVSNLRPRSFVNLQRGMNSIASGSSLALYFSTLSLGNDLRGSDWEFNNDPHIPKETRWYYGGEIYLKLVANPAQPDLDIEFVRISLPDGLMMEIYYKSLLKDCTWRDDWSEISAGPIDNSNIHPSTSISSAPLYAEHQSELYKAFTADVARLRLWFHMKCQPPGIVQHHSITVGAETNVPGAVFKAGKGFLLAFY